MGIRSGTKLFLFLNTRERFFKYVSSEIRIFNRPDYLPGCFFSAHMQPTALKKSVEHNGKNN